MLLVFAFCVVAACGSLANELMPKIVGGSDAIINEAPYQISLQIWGVHMCGGAIINPNTIITAAHCTDGHHPFEFAVLTGVTLTNEPGIFIPVIKVIQHELFTMSTINYDISILKLAGYILFDITRQPIALQPSGVEVPVGTRALLTGWGATKFEGATTNRLRKATMTVIDINTCAAKLNRYNKVTQNMICVATPGVSACSGDSGGPLAANGRLIGVVSWGVSCSTTTPSVFTKISELRPWIDAHIND